MTNFELVHVNKEETDMVVVKKTEVQSFRTPFTAELQPEEDVDVEVNCPSCEVPVIVRIAPTDPKVRFEREKSSFIITGVIALLAIIGAIYSFSTNSIGWGILLSIIGGLSILMAGIGYVELNNFLFSIISGPEDENHYVETN